jgi:hypothetical protein
MIIIILVPQTNEHYKPISRRQLFLPGVWNDNNMPQGFKAQMARPRIVVTKATKLDGEVARMYDACTALLDSLLALSVAPTHKRPKKIG